MSYQKLSFCLVCLFFFAGCSTPSVQIEKTPHQKVLIIGHRGASGYRPEHTLASYDLAIEMGADFIEPDLVMTKDYILIARHENEISGTTDVAEKFPTRKRTKKIDGKEVTGWFTEDFTLKEIKTLRAKERLARRDQSDNGKYEIPTFAEILDLAQKRSEELHRVIGVYPETKHPSYFVSIQHPLEKAVANELTRVGWNKSDSPVILQSFELSSLKKLKALVACRLVFLYDDADVVPYDGVLAKNSMTYRDYTKPEQLKKISEIAYGIGPSKRLIVPIDENGELQPATTLIKDAHEAGLKVHPYTFRSDAPFLAKQYKGDPTAEYLQFFDLGVDGVFTDFSNHAIKALNIWNSK